MYNHFSLKRLILAGFLCSSLSILAVQAAEPASLAGQAHREVHTTTVTQTESHSSSRESASHSGWSVSRPSSLGTKFMGQGWKLLRLSAMMQMEITQVR
mgnify:CR=1 FL=1